VSPTRLSAACTPHGVLWHAALGTDLQRAVPYSVSGGGIRQCFKKGGIE
jgi:hypothetical protein